MEEWRAVALAERHRGKPEPRDPCGPKGVAVERGIGAGLRQCRHHISERTERAALHAEHAAGKSGLGKTAARGFQQRQAGFQRERKRAALRLDPLDALWRGRTGLADAAHQVPVDLAMTSSS